MNFPPSLMAVPATLIALVLGGCTHLDPIRLKQDFGASTLAMRSGQYFDPAVAANPSTEAPVGMDGAKAELILEKYREDVSDRNFDDSQQAITVLTAQ